MHERFTVEDNSEIDLSYFEYVIFSKFPESIRREVREKQDYQCAWCGEHDDHLEVHHVLPKSMGGPDMLNNAVGLCGPSVNDCHQIFDSLALENHVIYPGVPLDDIGEKFFKKR